MRRDDAERPLVSVVVPFFRSARTLEACIASLLGQEAVGGPVEIILVDNGSPDGSAEIARRHAGVTLLEETVPGAYAARNTGIRHASAPIIALTDADCTADPDWLRSIVAGMADRSTAVLLGHCRYPEGASWRLRLLEAYENAKTAYVLGRLDRAYHFAYANNMAVRASLFDAIGPFETWRRAADSELVHRLAERRPDLAVAFRPSMRVTHLEFERGRDRARRLRLYTRTNARIPTFRELGWTKRLGVLAHLLRGGGALSRPDDR